MDLSAAFIENEQWLRTIIRSRIDDSNAAEDVLQEVSIAALRNRDSASSINHIRGWLYQIAIRQVLLFRRTEARQRNKLKRYAVSGLASSGIEDASIKAGDESSEGIAELRVALATIRPSDRQILMMKYSDNLTCKQIAKHLGVKETTVQTRLLRARRKMKELLVAKQSATRSIGACSLEY